MRLIQIVVQTLCGLLLLAGVGVNFSNVVGRYLFARPLPWAEDFMVYANVWVILLGGALATFQNRHLSMDMLHALLAAPARRALLIAVAGVALVACGVTTWISGQFVARMVASGQRSISLDIPMFLPHAAVVAGFALMTLALARTLLHLIAGRTVDAAPRA